MYENAKRLYAIVTPWHELFELDNAEARKVPDDPANFHLSQINSWAHTLALIYSHAKSKCLHMLFSLFDNPNNLSQGVSTKCKLNAKLPFPISIPAFQSVVPVKIILSREYPTNVIQDFIYTVRTMLENAHRLYSIVTPLHEVLEIDNLSTLAGGARKVPDDPANFHLSQINSWAHNIALN